MTISNGRRRVLLHITPNAYPAISFNARRELPDDSPVSFIQDPESTGFHFLPRLDLEDELDFRFTFVARQTASASPIATTTAVAAPVDTSINGLTFAYASNTKELDTLVTREFHADPNLHKNSNVQFIGDFNTEGSPSIEFEWNWRWKPPKTNPDKGGGWRHSCSFLEYDSRAHRLNTMASFAFWVHKPAPLVQTPVASPGFDLAVPMHRNQRMPSSQSYQSAVSDTEDFIPPPSPHASSNEFVAAIPSATSAPPVIDVLCQRPGEDMSSVEDGPLFRATMKSLEQKTGNMRVQIKKVLKKAEAAHLAQVECNTTMKAFLGALQEASGSNASAFKPALDHYFTKIARRILDYEMQNAVLLQKQIIEPVTRLYNLDIKAADQKKKDFDEESKDYYAYVSRYLGQRSDSLKEKKRAESDSKYQTKKRNFELKRFDYSSFMQDLHGGRKEQELLSQLTRYADGQAKSFMSTSNKVESLIPQLDALVKEVSETDKDYQVQRTEREEKRRNLEKNSTISPDTDPVTQIPSHPSSAPSQNGAGGYNSDTDLRRADSTSSQFAMKTAKALSPSNSLHAPGAATLSTSPGGTSISTTPSRFKGIRDLEERDSSMSASLDKTSSGQFRKEGLLWALSKPGSHIDPKGINKQAWHKYVHTTSSMIATNVSRFWVVLDQGKLSEYSNWKDKLDLHRDPIDLRMASVRMARDADRRFCFEVITPQYKRVFQATSEDDMNNWIYSINNALQSAVEGRSGQSISQQGGSSDFNSREYGSVLTGKTYSQSGPHGHVHANKPDTSGVARRVTVGARPSYVRTTSSSFEDNPSKLLEQIRANDQGNAYCVDCGSTSKVEWVSLNLAILLCIECGGIHRSLGTHVSKIRSLTLDIYSFTSDIVELILLVGNRISNMVWEANLDHTQKPDANATREQRLKFITAKYVDRAYVDPNTGQFPSVEESLLTSIKKNDVQGVLQAIAQRANVNAHDRSRNTHAVFLALAAADPAYPLGTPQNPIGSPKTPTSAAAAKAFPIAELLVQNGSEIPNEAPPIPLSQSAQLYIEQRTAKASSTAGGNDTLGPLPNVSGRGIVAVEGGTTKLQKRGSAGSRFAGKVVGLGER